MTIAKADYHSALWDEQDYPAMDRWESPEGNVALTWDLAAEHALPSDFNRCDVLYCEPPFRAGWDLFHDRADTTPAMKWGEFIEGVSSLYRYRDGVLMVGEDGRKKVNTPDHDVPTKLWPHSDHIVHALFYGIDPPHNAMTRFSTMDDVIGYLADSYRVVGDPCGGYGRAGRIFAERGLGFVMADINPRCVGYIKAHAEKWAEHARTHWPLDQVAK